MVRNCQRGPNPTNSIWTQARKDTIHRPSTTGSARPPPANTPTIYEEIPGGSSSKPPGSTVRGIRLREQRVYIGPVTRRPGQFRTSMVGATDPSRHSAPATGPLELVTESPTYGVGRRMTGPNDGSDEFDRPKDTPENPDQHMTDPDQHENDAENPTREVRTDGGEVVTDPGQHAHQTPQPHGPETPAPGWLVGPKTPTPTLPDQQRVPTARPTATDQSRRAVH